MHLDASRNSVTYTQNQHVPSAGHTEPLCAGWGLIKADFYQPMNSRSSHNQYPCRTSCSQCDTASVAATHISWNSQGGRMPALSRSHLMQPLMASSLLCIGVPSFRCVCLLYIHRIKLSPGMHGLKIRLIVAPRIALPRSGQLHASLTHLRFQASLWDAGTHIHLYSSASSRSSRFARQPKGSETCPVRART